MHNRYVLTLAAIEARLYTDEADSIFMRWPTAEKELPSGNHTPGGLSETCLHFMEDIMTKTGRPNHKWDNFLYLHFGGWDLLMDYVKRDPKRRGYLLRCEEKGYSVSGDRHFFDEALVMNGIVNGTAAAIPSSAMNCVVEANIYLVRGFCGAYSSATMDSLCEEIRRFLETGSDEEKGLAPQMDPQDRYYIFMYIRACLDRYEAARNDGADADALSRHLGTALAWLVLAALLRDSCENLCRLIPSPSIQLLRVRVREAQSSPAPAVAPASLPPVPALFLGREEELEQVGRYFDSSTAPFFICGEGACGKTSLAAAFASHADQFTSIYTVYSGGLVNTVASIRFRDTLPMDRADVGALYEFNLSRLTQYSSRVLLIIDNFDAPHYDRTFTEMMAEGGGSSAALGGEAPTAGSAAGVAGPAAPALSAKATSAGSVAGVTGPAVQDGAPALTNADVLEDLMRAGVRLLFTTRASVPPQYASLCLSDAEHELPLRTLLALAKKIYSDCRWTEYDEVLMSQIILTVGKHVMLVELLSAALQQQSGFTSLEDVLEKLKSLQLPQIEGSVTTRRNAAAGSSVYDLMRRIFSFSDYEEPVRQMLRQLSLLSPLGIDREPFLQIVGCGQEQGCRQEEYHGIKETLLRLRDLHLVTIDPRTAHITMHPVLSDVAAADLKPDAQNCGVMIANAVRYFDEDSTSRYDARHLEQVSAMCARCAVLLSGQLQGRTAVNAPSAVDSQPQGDPEVEVPSAVDSHPQGGTAVDDTVDELLVDLALAVSGIEYRLGNYRAASAWAEQALKALNAMDSPAVKSMADSLKCAARACAKLGLYEEACRYYQAELDILSGKTGTELEALPDKTGETLETISDEAGAELEALPVETRSELATAWNDYGVTLEEMGRFEEALDCLTNAWEIQKDLFGADSLETISTCNNLGLICADLGDLETAETFYRHAIRISSKYYKEAHPETAVLYSNLGELLMHIDEGAPGEAEDDALMKSRLVESRQCLTKALDIYTAAFGPSYPENACVLSNLGILEDTEGNHKKAREHYRKALEIQSAVAGIDHPHCADILHNLGVSYIDEALESFDSPEAFADAPMDQKRDFLPLLNKALACERKALTILTAVFGESHYSVEMLGNEIAWIENEGMRAD